MLRYSPIWKVQLAWLVPVRRHLALSNSARKDFRAGRAPEDFKKYMHDSTDDWITGKGTDCCSQSGSPTFPSDTLLRFPQLLLTLSANLV